VLLVAGLLSGTVIDLPVYSLQPGPARNVVKLVTIHGQETFPGRGALLLTTVAVSTHPVSLFEGFAAMFDSSTQLVERSVIVQPGLTNEDQDQLNMAEMVQSKYAAAIAAFRAIGRSAPPSQGARVVYVFENDPAFGKLQAGDVVLAVDGATTRDVESVSERIRAHRPGQTVTFEVRRAGAVRQVSVRVKQGLDDSGKPIPIVGVSLAPDFELPVDIQIDTQDIGGPSGGLVFALAIVEVLGRDDLTKGHIVAATGTIDLDGNVGEIGGIQQKVRAAEASGADVFLVPSSEAPDARKVARTVRIVGVRTLQEALAALAELTPAR
jgi:PDZ domain-containing protein